MDVFRPWHPKIGSLKARAETLGHSVAVFRCPGCLRGTRNTRPNDLAKRRPPSACPVGRAWRNEDCCGLRLYRSRKCVIVRQSRCENQTAVLQKQTYMVSWAQTTQASQDHPKSRYTLTGTKDLFSHTHLLQPSHYMPLSLLRGLHQAEEGHLKAVDPSGFV